jgi:hypothetical protein
MIRKVMKTSMILAILALSLCLTPGISGISNQQLIISNTQPETIGGIPPQEEWNKTFGDPYIDDAAYDVQQTTDGGYIVAGYAKSFGVALWNPWLIKTDAQGNEEWNVTYDYYSLPTVSGRAWSVQQTTDEGYILGCTFYNATLFNAEENRPYHKTNQGFLSSTVLIKTDAQGNEEWNNTYPGLNYSWCYSARQTRDGGYIATGGGNSSTEGSPELYLLKTHPDGSLQWLQTYGTTDMDEEGHMVQQTTDAGYIITGMSDCNYDTDWGKLWLLKTDANGAMVWEKKFQGTKGDQRSWFENYGNSVQQTSDNGFIIAGIINYQSCLLKTDANGNETWRKTPFLNDYSFFCYSGKQTMDGGYIATCNGIIKTDASGNEAWNITIPTPFTAGQQTSDGGYIIAGSSAGYYNGDVWLIKFGPDPGTPDLSLTITGGLGIHVQITNNGTADAINVPCEIHVEGGILHRINQTVQETIDVPIGQTKTIETGMILGFGSILVTVMVGEETKSIDGTQLLIFSLLHKT